MSNLKDRIEESLSFLQAKYMELEYYFAENDRYPAGAEDDAIGYEQTISTLKDAKALIEKTLVDSVLSGGMVDQATNDGAKEDKVLQEEREGL